MEDALVQDNERDKRCYHNSLNPCFNGRYTSTITKQISELIVKCLNPCFNGRFTSTQKTLGRLDQDL